MKKLMYILVVLLSILTFSISYTNQNREDVSILGSFSNNQISKITDKKNYRILIVDEPKQNNQQSVSYTHLDVYKRQVQTEQVALLQKVFLTH